MSLFVSASRGLSRRALTFGAAAAAVATLGLGAAPARAESAASQTLRIGYQKYGTLTLLKARGTLDQRLAAQGIKLQWTEFPAGPQLLEALNVGSIDFGTVGEAPPIFAQAAGADLVYVANQPAAPSAEAIVVAKDSPLKSVAELKGKRVALNKGSNVHYLLVQALKKAGLQLTDIQSVYLPPADARAAFQRGAVDAWVIWDPFLAAAQKQLGARVLADGTGLVQNHQFFLAARPYAKTHAAVVDAIVDELAKLDQWAQGKPDEVAKFLAPQIGLDVDVAALAARRFAYGIKPITPEVVGAQQQIADTFHSVGLIPKAIRIRDALPDSATATASAR
jgi:sulfonate transport system substrate-binding protein